MMARAKQPLWAALPDRELLDLRICDLGLSVSGTVLEERVERLYEELADRRIDFRPHCWLSEEWFSPDGVPGIAIAFYLAHPRLMKLERKMMMEVEGGSESWSMKLLRHEAGHALDTAFRLSQRVRWRRVFGNPRKPYPKTYRPKPTSKRYVQHLALWYAQAHPSEDFAETFAVWLKPRSRWRHDYKSWPALSKLEYVDELMNDMTGLTSKVRSRKHVASIRNLKTTLRDHYTEKRALYAIDHAELHDQELRRLFVDNYRAKKNAMTAAAFLRRHRRQLCEVVAFWTGQNTYGVHQVLRDMQQRCLELGLRVGQQEDVAMQQAVAMLSTHIINYLHSGRYRIAV